MHTPHGWVLGNAVARTEGVAEPILSEYWIGCPGARVASMTRLEDSLTLGGEEPEHPKHLSPRGWHEDSLSRAPDGYLRLRAITVGGPYGSDVNGNRFLPAQRFPWPPSVDRLRGPAAGRRLP